MPHLRIVLNLTNLHCHTELQERGNAAPYLWTTFFWADRDTFGIPDHLIASFTTLPTGRGLFSNDVSAGDDLTIPAVIGRRIQVLNDGEVGIMLFGCLAVLLEQDATSEVAIHFGHLAYGDSLAVALNEHLGPQLVRLSTLPLAEREALIAEIEGKIKKEVKAAVERAVKASSTSLFELLANHDDLVDFSSVSFDFAQLNNIIAEPRPVSLRFKQGFPTRPGLSRDYEATGLIRVEPFTPPGPDPCQEQLDVYARAIGTLKTIDEELKRLMSELAGATPAERAAIIDEIQFIKANTRPDAIAAVEHALAAIQTCKSNLHVAPSFSELKPIV